jgi:hypothetical protein
METKFKDISNSEAEKRGVIKLLEMIFAAKRCIHKNVEG